MAEYAPRVEVDEVVEALVRQRRQRKDDRKRRHACECSDVRCNKSVVLWESQFGALRKRRNLILATGHVETAGQRQRRIAQTLRDESTALWEQAEQQVARAKENAQRMQPKARRVTGVGRRYESCRPCFTVRPSPLWPGLSASCGNRAFGAVS